MKVARQFIAWNAQQIDPSRRERCKEISLARVSFNRVSSSTRDLFAGGSRTKNQSDRTLRDGSFGMARQAINCLATFIQSLRDKNRGELP